MIYSPVGISLKLNRVTKRYGNMVAVNDVTLDIPSGEFLTLLGPSGSGKTTVLMMIAGFQDVDDGEILLGSRSIINTPPEKRNFGMVFQGYALFPHMNVRCNIAYPLEVRRRSRAEIEARVNDMLELVQLQSFGDRLPQQLSGGQQQRVALARALCFSPQILLLDEPLGALDKKLRVEVQQQLKDIHRRVGTTFIYVTHDQEEALSMSDRIVIMNHGEIVQVGSPNELYERPSSIFAANFLGKSNFLKKGGHVYALRPEKIDIAPAGKGKELNRLTGHVHSISYLGLTLKLIVKVAGMDDLEVLTDAWRNQHQFTEGQPVDLTWNDAAAVLIENSTGILADSRSVSIEPRKKRGQS